MYRVLAYILVAPLYLCSLLPLRVHYFFSDILCWILRDVAKYRRDVIDTNLSGALPAMPQAERDAIKRDYYRYLADVVCETVWAMTRSGQHLRRKGFYRVDVDGERLLNDIWSQNKPLVALLGHTGNWELASDLPNYMQNPAFGTNELTAAYQTLHSPLSEQLFLVVRHKRLHGGDSLVASHKILRMMLERRSEPRIYFFIADQYPYGGVSRTNTFLGLETEWATGGEAIARKLHLPVIYIYLDRVKRGEYVIKISQICPDASVFEEGEVTDTFAHLLEKEIAARKYNWLWSHRRWKNLWPYNCNKKEK